jgi:A/G-specific adenine glycosylase
MDLAAAPCGPRATRCGACPLADVCASRDQAIAAPPARRVVPFPGTTRWLRGRLVARVTRAPVGEWVKLPARLGSHDAEAIEVAAQGLAREGFLEVRPGEARVLD